MPTTIDGMDPISRVHAVDVSPPPPGRSTRLTITLGGVTEQPTLTCTRCGRTAADPQPTWMLEHDRRAPSQWFCDSCAREHLRAIESRLSQEWW